jgi:hypothetical protein
MSSVDSLAERRRSHHLALRVMLTDRLLLVWIASVRVFALCPLIGGRSQRPVREAVWDLVQQTLVCTILANVLYLALAFSFLGEPFHFRSRTRGGVLFGRIASSPVPPQVAQALTFGATPVPRQRGHWRLSVRWTVGNLGFTAYSYRERQPRLTGIRARRVPHHDWRSISGIATRFVSTGRT